MSDNFVDQDLTVTEGPPPMNVQKSVDIFDDDDDVDDLFRSAVGPKEDSEKGGGSTKNDDESSGYNTNTADINVAKSNTLDDISGGDHDVFKSAAGLEPDPEKARNGGTADQEIPLDDDDEENAAADIPVHYDDDEDKHPFKDAHLQPQLQLTGGGHQEVVTSPSYKSLEDEVGAHKSSTLEEEIEANGGDDFIQVSVTNPHKVGEGMSSFMAYKVTTKTNNNYFRNKEMAVTRRFSDFLGLHVKLSEKYLQNGRIIPPAPDKSVVGMTKVKMSKDHNEASDEFVERRRAALERFLNRIADHPTLRVDPDYREFLERDEELPKANQTATLSSRSVMKLISKVGDSLSNMTLKMEETDAWFNDKTQVIEQLDVQLRKLHSSTETLAELRRNLAHSTGAVSSSLGVLSGCEDNSSLSAAIVQLSNVHEQIEKIHHEQASADFFYLSELIKDYIGVVGAIKDAFHERVKAWQSWQSTTAMLTKRREAKVKAELNQRMDKVAVLRQEIGELERGQEMAQENFDRISRQIKKEVEMFDVRKARDFKKNIVEYLESTLKAQERMAALWERYLPELQAMRL